jgi:integrase
MPKAVLTDIGVKALKPPLTGQLTIWDVNSPLGVRVSQGGSKTFIVLVGSGRRRTIGRYPTIGLSDARAEAKRIAAEHTLGIAEKPAAITFDAARTVYIEQKRGKPRTIKEAKRVLEKHFRPLNKTVLSDITDREIQRQLDKLSTTPSEALHAFRAVRAFFRWCIRPPRRYIAHSPLEGYDAPSQDRKRTRTLTDQELVKVWNAGSGNWGVLVRLLVLWGTRKTETALMRRTWIEPDLMVIPGEVTKNGREHAIPILPLARSLLEEVLRGTNRDILFPSRWDDEKPLHDGSWGKLKRELDEASGVTNWQIRDLRRTFRTNLARLGVRREIGEILLNHVTGANRNELDEIYDRYDYLAEKREALAKWEARVQELIAVSPPMQALAAAA